MNAYRGVVYTSYSQYVWSGVYGQDDGIAPTPEARTGKVRRMRDGGAAPRLGDLRRMHRAWRRGRQENEGAAKGHCLRALRRSVLVLWRVGAAVPQHRPYQRSRRGASAARFLRPDHQAGIPDRSPSPLHELQLGTSSYDGRALSPRGRAIRADGGATAKQRRQDALPERTSVRRREHSPSGSRTALPDLYRRVVPAVESEAEGALTGYRMACVYAPSERP